MFAAAVSVLVVKGVLSAALARSFGNVPANDRTDLFVYTAAAPAVKGAGLVLGCSSAEGDVVQVNGMRDRVAFG